MFSERTERLVRIEIEPYDRALQHHFRLHDRLQQRRTAVLALVSRGLQAGEVRYIRQEDFLDLKPWRFVRRRKLVILGRWRIDLPPEKRPLGHTYAP